MYKLRVHTHGGGDTHTGGRDGERKRRYSDSDRARDREAQRPRENFSSPRLIWSRTERLGKSCRKVKIIVIT